MGKDLSNRDWYKGMSTHWKPYISTVFKLIVGDKPLAVAVCVPIFDERERAIGILASSQRLSFLDDAIKRVPLSPYTTVNVIDRTGKILYSNKVPYQESITDYRFFPILETAVKEKKQQIEMNDPQKDQEKSYLTVVPVGDIGWSVVIERSQRDIFRSEFRRVIEIGAISFLLFLLIISLLFYLRKVSLFRKTEELLRAETRLRQREDTLRALSSRQESLLSAIPDIIMEVDGNKVYTWSNQAGMDFFGEDVVGKEAAFYFEGDQDTYKTVQQLFNGDENMIHLESRQRRKDGEKRRLSWRCRVLKDENGRVTGALSSARDITDRKEAEEELLRILESLRKAVGTTIQVMVSAVEARDPYTAGHQIRSADLARAIATEMGLPQEKIEGIRMAGSIHDIGKLSIPAEILSKPTRLTELEFSLIKEHSRSGYEMLKDVESPWPLAQIVYQHHERMNGSGYPRNLKGDDILIEARIMVVADVVESMASHRPYRPAFGIEIALE
jgi:PAS domain S-box-containing protein